jgi:toxin ParE1/3/4
MPLSRQTRDALVLAPSSTRSRLPVYSLAALPERGVPRDDISPGIRTSLLDRRITIAYRVDSDVVEIVRIFYAGRNYEALLRTDD